MACIFFLWPFATSLFYIIVHQALLHQDNPLFCKISELQNYVLTLLFEKSWFISLFPLSNLSSELFRRIGLLFG